MWHQTKSCGLCKWGADDQTMLLGCRAMQVVAEEQAADAKAASRQKEAQQQRQVIKALEASRLRAERATRVTKLKVGKAYHTLLTLPDTGLGLLSSTQKLVLTCLSTADTEHRTAVPKRNVHRAAEDTPVMWLSAVAHLARTSLSKNTLSVCRQECLEAVVHLE